MCAEFTDVVILMTLYSVGDRRVNEYRGFRCFGSGKRKGNRRSKNGTSATVLKTNPTRAGLGSKASLRGHTPNT